MDTKQIICPKCQGVPFRGKLVEDKDNLLMGASIVPTVCRYCNGDGYITVNKRWIGEV